MMTLPEVFRYVTGIMSPSDDASQTTSDEESDNDESPQISEAFRRKLENLAAIREYYTGAPAKDAETQVFADPNQYITTEGLAILLKNQIDRAYIENHDVSNTKLIEVDPTDFAQLQQFLNQYRYLRPGESIKLLVKTLECEEPKSWGVHPVPVYIRNCNGHANVFIHDCTAGIIFDQREGYQKLIPTLESFLQRLFREEYSIILSSTITQRDSTNCVMYALEAIDFFMSKGHDLFPRLEPHLVDPAKKLCHQNNPHIKHLKTDHLPHELLMMTNRRSIRAVQDGYNHKWFPAHPDILNTPAYYDNKNILAHCRGVKVDNVNTFTGILNYYSVTKRSRSNDRTYTQNTYADWRMAESRRQIALSLKQADVIETNESGAYINRQSLKRLVDRLPLSRARPRPTRGSDSL